MDGLSYEAASVLRNRATELLTAAGWEVLNPMRGVSSSTTIIGDSTLVERELTDRAIIDRDHDDIRRANVLLYLTADNLSWGSMFEVAYAASPAASTPVVAVASTIPASPWARFHVSKFCPTVEEAVAFIIDYYDDVLEKNYNFSRNATSGYRSEGQ
jgi:hypothetical protein